MNLPNVREIFNGPMARSRVRAMCDVERLEEMERMKCYFNGMHLDLSFNPFKFYTFIEHVHCCPPYLA